MRTITTWIMAGALAVSSVAAHAGGLAAPEVEAESFETAEPAAAPAAFGGLGTGGTVALIAALVLVAALASGGGSDSGGGGDGTK